MSSPRKLERGNHISMDLIGIGGANCDRIGRTNSAHLAGTSNPGILRESVGGGTFNALRVAALRQAGAIGLISARGNDSAGEQVARSIRQAGITDLSCITDRASTATYTAILDETGELITALADMTVYGEALPQHLSRPDIQRHIASAKAVLMDANLAEQDSQAICDRASGPIFAIAISASKVTKLVPCAKAIDVLFMNQHEARTITGESDIHLAARHCIEVAGFKKGVITRGKDPVLIAQADEIWSIDVPAAESVDVTGAGDALCGGTIAALLRNQRLSLPEAVREGIACSALTLQVNGPFCPAIATPIFDDVLASIPSPHAYQ